MRRSVNAGYGPDIAVDVVVEAGGWPQKAALKRLAKDAIAVAATLADADIVPDAEVAVVFTDDRHIRVLNRRYRKKDVPTNVLSFPGARRAGARFGPLLGDVVLAYETAEREAKEEGLAMNDHLTHLVVHGFLHLLGHDHVTESDASVMERLETAILASLGIADPYATGDR